MADYAIGDIQGCYQALMGLLTLINFDEHKDRLWLVGDLVNRGPQSLQVLQFLRKLPVTPRICLGNHDLHLLHCLYFPQNKRKKDTLAAVLSSPEKDDIAYWLRQHSFLHHDHELNIVMCHAGIAPIWSLEEAKEHAQEMSEVLKGECCEDYLQHMYGDKPNYWQPDLKDHERWRVITNYFTRMRFCDSQGHLQLDYKGTIAQAPAGLIPWFAVANRRPISADIVFGHWAALQGHAPSPHLFPIDTGCIWGGGLTALRLQDKKSYTFQ